MAIFIVTGLVLSLHIKQELTESLDRELLARAESFIASAHLDENGVFELDLSDAAIPEYGQGKLSAFYLISQDDGDEVKRSASLASIPFNLPDRKQPYPIDEPVYWHRSIGELHVRLVTLRSRIASEPDNTAEIPASAVYLFTVGLDTGETNETVYELLFSLILSMGAGLFILLVSGRYVIQECFKPLHRMEREVRALNPDRLTPIAVPPIGELAEVARAFNDAIMELKNAFERERRFTADVAHELRTPISEIRAAAEVSLSQPGELEPLRLGLLKDILDSSKSMQQTIQALLTLARCDAGRYPLQTEPIEFEPFLHDQWTPFEAAARQRGLEVTCSVAPAKILHGDRDILATILSNLFSNAVEYTPESGTLEWEADVTDGRLDFRISNTAGDLTTDDLPRMSERFWRKDAARSSNEAHSGLGLPLAAALADVAGLTLGLKLNGGRLSVSIHPAN